MHLPESQNADRSSARSRHRYTGMGASTFVPLGGFGQWQESEVVNASLDLIFWQLSALSYTAAPIAAARSPLWPASMGTASMSLLCRTRKKF